jgi:hypothetical protein
VLAGVTLTLTVAGVEVEGFTVTDAYAFASRRAALLAVTVTGVGAETDGAVKRPVLEIDPALADQTTEVLLVPLTVAENCCVLPAVTVALVGFKLTLTFVDVGGVTVTVAEALESREAALVAVTVT